MTATSNGLSDIEANPSSHSINQGPLPPDESLNHPESTREKSPPSSPPQISDSFDGDLVSVNYLSPTQSLSDRNLRSRITTAFHLQNGSSRGAPQKPNNSKLKLNTRSLDQYPKGYGKLAAFQDCDPNFLIYRKFSWLHNRVLLHRQDELVELEDRLERLDRFDQENDEKKLTSRRRDDAKPDSSRKELLLDIEKKLVEYDDMLLRFQRVQAVKQPTLRNQNSLYNFIHNTGSLVASEAEWVHCRDDLAAIAQDKEDGWFKGFLEDTLKIISRRATTYVFRSEEQRIRSGNEIINLFSHKRFNAFIYIIITILATVLLLVPVSVLWVVQNSGLHQILVIFFFTLTFAACCSVFTKARRQEVFAATAAYCAVLVVFLGNTQNQNKYIKT
ncbi:hypothetical protein MMC14_008411 [Varicellaria rhodocarpa]|nr:hypothetical protein [Varicellaria rhodocarpa]